MATYSLSFKPAVEKDLLAIPHAVTARIFTRIEQLPCNPFPSQSSKLQGAERLYRLRVGDYIYAIAGMCIAPSVSGVSR